MGGRREKRDRAWMGVWSAGTEGVEAEWQDGDVGRGGKINTESSPAGFRLKLWPNLHNKGYHHFLCCMV